MQINYVHPEHDLSYKLSQIQGADCPQCGSGLEVVIHDLRFYAECLICYFRAEAATMELPKRSTPVFSPVAETD